MASYTIREKLRAGTHTDLYRAIREDDQHPVILEMANTSGPGPERLSHALEIGRDIAHPAVLRVVGLDTHDGRWALVTEDFDGKPLDQVASAERPFGLDRFLPLALRCAAAVAALHACGVVHRDLKPESFLVSPTGEVRIVDLGLATRVRRETQSTLRIEGSFPYISPEQTGRTNRPVDSRSDLYALGVMFFCLLTGRLPFQADDPVGWVHCHVACRPPVPAELVRSLPDVVSDIVLKLLAKLPEQRYQSASGLEHDLARCLREWTTHGEIVPFRLGAHDWSGRLRFARVLIGRKVEQAELLAAFDRTVDGGEPELMLVSGDPGIGKSTLVQELQAPVVRRHGAFIAVKFEQYKQEIALLTVTGACRALLLEVLAEREERLATWRQRLEEQLGPNLQVLSGLIPELELIVGPQPPSPDLAPTEAENRLFLAFSQLVGVFARADRPLVLFFDALQWADPTSLRLLMHLVTDAGLRNLLVVGAYRAREVGASHPLSHLVADVTGRGGVVSEVCVRPLSVAEIEELLADALQRPPAACLELAVLVHQKTVGNPFFALRFLATLEQRGLLAFDHATGEWCWDAARIAAEGFTDNVVELLAGNVDLLPHDTREVVKRCACVGNVVSTDTLAAVAGCGTEALEAALQPALEGELLVRTPAGLRFAHDRVQEAAYSLVTDAERAGLHLCIGRILAEQTRPGTDGIFEVVHQLNRGAGLLQATDERLSVAELDLAAARRAMGSAAFDAGLEYCERGMGLLPPDAYDTCHELCFALHHTAAVCALAIGNADRTAELVDRLRGRSRTVRQDVDVALLGIELHTLRADYVRAVAVALPSLARLGIHWSAHPPLTTVVVDYQDLRRLLGDRPIGSLAELPPMTDPDALALMDLLNAFHDAAILTDLNLLALLACHRVRTSIRYGNAAGSAAGYASLGLVVGPVFGNYRDAPLWGDLGRALVERRAPTTFDAMALLDASIASQMSRHLREGLQLQTRAHAVALACGSYKFACYTLNISIAVRVVLGDPLPDVERAADEALRFVRRAGFRLVEALLTRELQLVRELRGRPPPVPSDDGFDFEADIETQVTELPLAACWHFVWTLESQFLLGDLDAALAAARRAEALIWSSPTFVTVPELHYFHALTLAARWDPSRPDEPARTKLRELAALFSEWSTLCPENFSHEHALVAAELCRVEGRHEQAAVLYEEAIREARHHGFVNHEAVSFEVASRAWRARGFARIADTYLREARACYVRWGADHKVAQLDRHAERVEPPPLPPGATLEELDLLSIVKASQTISGATDHDQLVRTLLQVVLEQGGARSARLLSVRADRVTLEAEAALDERGTIQVVVFDGADQTPTSIPETLLQFVRRTRAPVVLDDASADPGRFAGDAYLARGGPRSLVCLPILHQGVVVAMLNLENDLVPGVFTAERLTALELLASQAAISLENARLLQRNQEARREAEAARERLEVLFEERRRAAAESRFLADASELLAESIDYEDTLSRLARLGVPFLADWCMVDVVEDGQVRRVGGAHVDPAQQTLIDRLEDVPLDPTSARNAAAMAVRTGQTCVLSSLSDEDIRASTRNDAHADLLRALRPHSVAAVPLVAYGSTLGVMTFVVSRPGFRYGPETVAVAEELGRRATVALENARLYREAQASIRARDEFLSTASHELRSPVTSLLLTVQCIRQGKIQLSPEILVRVSGLLERQATRLGRLVDEMLLVGRIHSGRLDLELADVDLSSATRDVLDRLAPAIAESGSNVTLRAPGPVVGRWDEDKLARAITNLLDNALKFSDGKPIEITVEGSRGSARLAVTDHGIGIPPSALPHVFEKFTRAVSTRSYGGLGLGLHIVRSLVEAHGGSVTVASEPGAFTAVTVELPLSEARSA